MEYIVTRDENHDELKHYGVLGMKWGQRRARVNAMKSARARQAGNMEAAKKYKAKSEKIKAKHTKRAGGKEAYNYTAKESLGKSVVKSYLMGTYGTVRYNEARAKGASRGQAAINGVLHRFGNQFTGGLLSVVEPRLRK